MGVQYTGIQRLSMAAMVIAGGMCVAGGLAPYWIVSEPEGFGFVGSVIGQFVKGYMGLFMYCLEIPGQKGCEVFDSDDGFFNKERIFACLCMLVGCVTGFTALCLCCCTCCERLICLGIMSALTSAAGIACVVTYTQNTDLFTSTVSGFKLASYGWAFYVFCVGVGLFGLASFPACFAAPERSTSGVGAVVQPAPATVMVNMDSNSTFYANPQWQGQGQGQTQGYPGPLQGYPGPVQGYPGQVQGYPGQGPVMGSPWQGQGQGQGQALPGQISETAMIKTPVQPGVEVGTSQQ